MNRDQIAASARAAVAIAAGAAVFVALGWLTRWWVALIALLAGSGAAGVYALILVRRIGTWRPW